jgi:signal-transduction protein with cAMP-binding, CBS, and nucleotidyltransferase domain
MTCADLMSELEWISSAATVQQAAQVMRDRSVDLLMVFDPTLSRVVGIVTDRDLAVRACAENKRPDQTQVADLVTSEVLTCAEIDDIAVAQEKMLRAGRSRIIVADRDGRPAGMVSLNHILSLGSMGRATMRVLDPLPPEAAAMASPLEEIHLTPSTPEDEDAAIRQETIVRGDWTGSMKEFPG